LQAGVFALLLWKSPTDDVGEQLSSDPVQQRDELKIAVERMRRCLERMKGDFTKKD